MHQNRPRAAIAALILALAAAPVASAATTGDVSETFSVTSTLSLTLNKASIDYGSIDPGSSTSTSASSRTVTASVGGNEGAWSLSVTGSAFSRTGGGSLPASVRTVKAPLAGIPDWSPVPVSVNGSLAQSIAFEFAANPPANAPSGSYSGTITFTVTGS